MVVAGGALMLQNPVEGNTTALRESGPDQFSDTVEFNLRLLQA